MDLRGNGCKKKSELQKKKKKQQTRKQFSWRKIHRANHLKIAHSLLPSLRDGW